MRIAITLAALLAASAASAQPGQPSRGRPVEPEGWSITVGVAPVVSPAWQGSKDMGLSIFPDLRINYGDTIFASIPEGVGWNAVNDNGWKAGPLAKLRFGRDEEGGGSPFLITGGSDALNGLGDIGATAEVGGFVEKRIGPWRARAEVRRGFGGHEGVVADASAAYQLPTGRTIINAGPRATWASRDYMDTFFGIDAAQSARSGLQTYSPGGGLLSYGLGGTVIRPLTGRSAMTLFTGLDRLGEEAGDSPLVRERGRRTQFTLGVGYGLRIGL